MQSIIILGRQPAIGLAELESLYGAKCLQPIGHNTVLIDLPANAINFNRLGGALKLGQVLEQTSQANLKSAIINGLEQLDLTASGKIVFGISAYGFNITTGKLQAMAMTIKKTFQNRNIHLRFIPNRALALNSAQVLHNQLTTNHGIELLLIGNQDSIIIAKTDNVQNITDYASRDRQRPKRDTYVGMLPPKLAQIIINLAARKLPTGNSTILDPFCGTGVVMQEALLMGFGVYGSDLSDRMVDYTKQNIDWLRSQSSHIIQTIKIESGDARHFRWQPPISAVASETYLGQALTHPLSPANLNVMVQQINDLHKQFLQNIHKQISSGTRLCLAVPAWYVNQAYWHLPVLDQLDSLGYNRVALKYAKTQELIYHRADQLVARELVILVRK